MRAFRLVVIVMSFGTSADCATAQVPFEDAETGLRTIEPEAIRAHMTFLADDLLEGREAGQRGFQLAANYVAAQFRLLGLEPPLEQGTYFQTVPFRDAQPIPAASTFAMASDEDTKPLEWGEDVLFQGDPFRTDTVVSAPLAFVGFGVSAADLQYDDYSIDTRGKVVVMLPNAPASFPEHERAYYGSVEVKRGNAIAHGTVGILEVHPDELEGRHPWNDRRTRIEVGETGLVGRGGASASPGIASDFRGSQS